MPKKWEESIPLGFTPTITIYPLPLKMIEAKLWLRSLLPKFTLHHGGHEARPTVLIRSCCRRGRGIRS
jgi:hypothetical protein